MTDRVFAGRKGSGKSTELVFEIVKYLKRGLKVASNVRMNLEHVEGFHEDARIYLLPQVPTSYHISIEVIGYGNDFETYTDDQNGLLGLDEMGRVLEARNFMGADRAAFLEAIVNFRKRRLDTIYVAHDLNVLDKRIRDGHIDEIRLIESLKNKYAAFKRFMPDLNIVRTYDQTYSPTNKKKNLLSRYTRFPSYLHPMYSTDQIFSLPDSFVFVPLTFRVDRSSIFVANDPERQGLPVKSGFMTFDMRVVAEMVHPKYKDVYPERKPYLNTNSFAKYLLGFSFIGFISIWKYVFGALVLYIVFNAGSDVIGGFMDKGNDMLGGVTSDKTTNAIQQESFDPSAFKPINVDESVKPISDNGKSTTDKSVDFLPPLPPKVVINSACGSGQIRDAFLERYSDNAVFEIKNVFTYHNDIRFSVVFFDRNSKPYDIMSSVEMVMLGWSFTWFNESKGLLFMSIGDFSIIYPVRISASDDAPGGGAPSSFSSIVPSMFEKPQQESTEE